jgi:hypothetical protein
MSMTIPSQRWSAALLVVALIGPVAGACLYDPGQRCGPAMQYVAAADACVCDRNAVPVAGGCQVCAADEIPSGGKCVCPPGETRTAQGACAKVAGLGDPCDTASTPCTDATYSFCATKGSGTAGTCTRACTASSDCDAAYTCATWDAHPHCRTFEGLGDSCTSPADCTGDAQFCDTFQTHTCIVAGCSLTTNDCPRGQTCCDFSSFGIGNLCAGACQ